MDFVNSPTQIQEECLQVQYTIDNALLMNLRMNAALALVPLNDVVRAFNDLKRHCGQAERPALDYFEATYVRVRRSGRRYATDPLFIIRKNIWSKIFGCFVL